MVQDSDGAAIASTPSSAAPSQVLEIELEFGVENCDAGIPLPNMPRDITLPSMHSNLTAP